MNIVSYALIVILSVLLILAIISLISLLTSSEMNAEDKKYQMKKGFFNFWQLLLKNSRKFLEFSQYGQPRVDPKKVMLGTLIENLVEKTKVFDPANKAKKEIEGLIVETAKVLEEAAQNAVRHNSEQAKKFVLDCFNELNQIASNLYDIDSWSKIKERICTIKEHAEIIAVAPTFDDANTGSSSNSEAKNQTIKTYYEVLQVSPAATLEEIKKAFHDLAKKYHPDRYSGLADELKDLAEVRFKEINEAYQVLSNPEKRKQYDQTIS